MELGLRLKLGHILETADIVEILREIHPVKILNHMALFAVGRKHDTHLKTPQEPETKLQCRGGSFFGKIVLVVMMVVSVPYDPVVIEEKGLGQPIAFGDHSPEGNTPWIVDVGGTVVDGTHKI